MPSNRCSSRSVLIFEYGKNHKGQDPASEGVEVQLKTVYRLGEIDKAERAWRDNHDRVPNVFFFFSDSFLLFHENIFVVSSINRMTGRNKFIINKTFNMEKNNRHGLEGRPAR